GNNRNHIEIIAKDKFLPSPIEFIRMLSTFGLTVIAWIFFRADNIGHAISYTSEIFSSSLFSFPEIRPKSVILLIIVFILIEWFGREGQYALAHIGSKWKRPFMYALYYVIIIAIFWFSGGEQQFIYFQF
ncbi:MAG: MBOAT family protein, partial [Cyclobacteriaceae bacterium]